MKRTANRKPYEETLTIKSLTRLRLSTNGNPRFNVEFTNGRTEQTGTDASVGYEIENREWHGVPVIVQFTGAGKIVGLRHTP